MKKRTLFIFQKTLTDHGKITDIPLIFIVNPGFHCKYRLLFYENPEIPLNKKKPNTEY